MPCGGPKKYPRTSSIVQIIFSFGPLGSVKLFRVFKTRFGFVSSKIYDKRDDFDFDIVNFPFLDCDVPRCASYSVYISQLIRFARVCNHVTDFNARNKCLTAKLLQQGYRYHKLRKTFF